MMSDSQLTAYNELLDRVRQVALLKSCGSVLEWDEQTGMPPGGAEFRSNQLALLAGMSHDLATSPRIGELLETLHDSHLAADQESIEAANLREIARDYRRATCLPKRLVEEMSKTTSLSQQAWISARKERNFAAFLPWLEKVIGLKREVAQAIGYGNGVPYDALLDEYEPGVTSADVSRLFEAMRTELVPLIAAVRDSGKSVSTEVVTRNYPVEAQREFSVFGAKSIGFSFEEGRLDVAAHPFCSGFGPGDCRLTTRFDPHHFNSAFFGTLHEAGHGMYEQGLDRAAFGTPLGNACSLAIHESQSRLWENLVGRSRSFWQWAFPKAREQFPEALGTSNAEELYRAVNTIEPSFIRVEADEATYNLHILLRFDMERLLIAGDLQPADVPGHWNQLVQQYLGITPDHDSNGCLQDIHWSAGLVGYFPTYALGNMCATQFLEAARKDLGDLEAQFASGDFRPLKEWMNEKIHRHGRRYHAMELVRRVTGEPLSHRPLIRHLKAKALDIYGI